MALNLASRIQVTAHFFTNRRNAAALSHHGVSMEFDPTRRQRASLVLGCFLALLAVGLMFILSWFKPAGQVGNSDILADRDTGAIYVLVDGRLHPALNLVSARLVAGSAANPTFVKSKELEKFPQGPMVGIPGAPAAMPIRTGATSQWTVCDTADPDTPTDPVVTAIAGPVVVGQRSSALALPEAVLASHGERTYVIWDGRRSQVDLANKALTLALGIDTQAPEPVELSPALFDALPATDPLVVPQIAGAGDKPRWDLAPDVVVGSVLSVRELQSDTDTFYVVLEDGVQRISPFVASLLRSTNSFGDTVPASVSPDRLTSVPQVDSLPVAFYPPTRLSLVDTAVAATTCVTWSKGSTDQAAVTQVLSGQGLPISIADDVKLLPLVKGAVIAADPDDTDHTDDTIDNLFEADQVYIASGATNLVMATSAAAGAQSRETLWWISDQGVRFGIALEDQVLTALGVAPGLASQAPWPLIRVFAQGPALTRADALVQHDTVVGGGDAQVLTTGGAPA